MRILFVTPYLPTPIRVRPYNFIKSLNKLGHKIYLVCLVQKKDESSDIENYCEKVKKIYLSKFSSYINCLLNLFSGAALQSVYCFSGKMSGAVREVLKEEKFDVIHVEHIRGSHFLPEERFVPAVFDSVDCISFLYEQFALNPRQPFLKKVINKIEAQKLKGYEGRQAERFDAVCITSEKDKQELLKLNNNLKIKVVTNGVDLEYFKPSGKESGKKETQNTKHEKKVVFTGKMSYFANEDAVMWFASEVWPLLKQSAAKLYIVGNEPGKRVKSLAGEDIVVTGYVPDLRDYIAGASVVIAPTTVGAGVQNKVLEAMAMGKAVVATSKACSALEGVVNCSWLVDTDTDYQSPVINYSNIVIANTAEDFAKVVMELLKNEELATKLGENARKYVEENHRWLDKAKQLEELYKSVTITSS